MAKSHMYTSGPLDLLVVLDVFIACVRSVGTAAVLACPGVILARKGVISRDVSRGMSQVSMQVTIPCLLFSSVVPGISTHLLRDCWPLIVLPFVYVPVGLAVGYLVVLICRPHPSFRKSTIAAVAFGNSTGMPIVLLTVIHMGLGGPATVDPLLYLSVYLIFYPVLQWSLGGWLLGVGKKGHTHGAGTPVASPAAIHEGQLLPPAAAPEESSLAASQPSMKLPAALKADTEGDTQLLPPKVASGTNSLRSLVTGAQASTQGDMHEPLLRSTARPDVARPPPERLQTVRIASAYDALELVSAAGVSNDDSSVRDGSEASGPGACHMDGPAVIPRSSTDSKLLPPSKMVFAGGRRDLSIESLSETIPHLSCVADGERFMLVQGEEESPSPPSESELELPLMIPPKASARKGEGPACTAVIMHLARRVARSAVRKLKRVLKQTFKPAVIAVACGIVTGLVPQLKALMLPINSAPFGWLFIGVQRIGQAAVPINLMLLGATLSKGPSWSQISFNTNMGIIIAKMLVVPVIGACTVIGFAQLVVLPESIRDAFWLVALVVTCTPTANNIIVMCDVAGENKLAMGTSIFTQYCVAPLLLPGVITLFVLIVSSLL